ncbi:MAG: hypothetical protein ACI8X3_002489, partial [Saprospiraceae bacterium]
SIQLLEAAFGEKVFLSGPHTTDMNFNSTNSFGHYNPDFISSFRSAWETATANPEFKKILESLYYDNFQEIGTAYFNAYKFINQNPKLLEAMEAKYTSEMNSSEGLDFYNFNEYFRSFADLEEKKGLNWYQSFNAPSFWIRRSIDGTASQLYELQLIIMQTFELDFNASVTPAEKAEYETIIHEISSQLGPEISYDEYPEVNNIPVEDDPAIFKLMETAGLWNLLKTNYDDEYWVNVGFRAKYEMAKKYASIQLLEAAFGEKVFLSGPHTTDMNFYSNNSFGHYNPAFISSFRSAWETATAIPKFKEALKSLYYDNFQEIGTAYFNAYKFINQNPKLLEAIEAKYINGMNSNGGLDFNNFNNYFNSFSGLEEQKGLNVYQSYNAPSFWIRRSIDGTASQLYELQLIIMQTFELDFTARVTPAEKAEYETIIQEIFLQLSPEIPNDEYPEVKNKPVIKRSQNATTFIDNRDQQSYDWILLNDGNKWMTNNVSFSYIGSSNEDCSYCQAYGRLYTWDMAQKACPQGWRLPTASEWDHLIEIYGGRYDAYHALVNGGSGGFSALLGGDGSFYNIGDSGYYWSGSAIDNTQAWQYTFFSTDGAKINKYEDSKNAAYSCRCIKE